MQKHCQRSCNSRNIPINSDSSPRFLQTSCVPLVVAHTLAHTGQTSPPILSIKILWFPWSFCSDMNKRHHIHYMVHINSSAWYTTSACYQMQEGAHGIRLMEVFLTGLTSFLLCGVVSSNLSYFYSSLHHRHTAPFTKISAYKEPSPCRPHLSPGCPAANVSMSLPCLQLRAKPLLLCFSLHPSAEAAAVYLSLQLLQLPPVYLSCQWHPGSLNNL